MIATEVNAQAPIAKLDTLIAKTDRTTMQSLDAVAQEALRLTQFEVPHDEGTLQNSGAVEPVRDGVVLGYHTPYAARLHEHPEYNFQKGRKGKYIEDPLIRNEAALGLTFGKQFQMRLF